MKTKDTLEKRKEKLAKNLARLKEEEKKILEIEQKQISKEFDTLIKHIHEFNHFDSFKDFLRSKNMNYLLSYINENKK